MHLIPLLIACSGGPTEPAEPEPVAPRRAEVPKPAEIRAPVAPPPKPVVDIDLESADPMAVVEASGPGGQPLEALSLVVASRGDGEIEPCG